MDQGFWLFFIFQLIALGMLAEKLNLVGLRRMALMAGLGGSLGAALFTLLLNSNVVMSDFPRMLFKWVMLAAMMASLIATAAAVMIPPELARKRA